MPFHDSWKLLFPGSAWEHTAWPALPASDEAEPRGQCVTRRSLVTSSRSPRIVKIDLRPSGPAVLLFQPCGVRHERSLRRLGEAAAQPLNLHRDISCVTVDSTVPRTSRSRRVTLGPLKKCVGPLAARHASPLGCRGRGERLYLGHGTPCYVPMGRRCSPSFRFSTLQPIPANEARQC